VTKPAMRAAAIQRARVLLTGTDTRFDSPWLRQTLRTLAQTGRRAPPGSSQICRKKSLE
jgi:hypothetical protein